jgi:hypothetical protein
MNASQTLSHSQSTVPSAKRDRKVVPLLRKAPATPTAVPPQQPDFILDGGGSLFLLRPISDAGRAWVEENIGQENGYQPYWPTVVVEHRFIADIVAGVQRDGLAVR